MRRRFSWIAVGFLIMWQFACGGGNLSPNSSGTPSANISVSPGSAIVGSPSLTLTVSGSKNFTFSSATHMVSLVIWSQGGIDTSLLTAFVNTSQLTAILPAPFLASAVTAKVRVEIWDVQGDVPIATSSSVPFQVTSAPTPTPAISSVTPTSVTAGSQDFTITIVGTGFPASPTYNKDHPGVLWQASGAQGGVWLAVDISQCDATHVIATVPAALVQTAGIFTLQVQIYYFADDMPKSVSNLVNFAVN